jgi:hypothetical protein
MTTKAMYIARRNTSLRALNEEITRLMAFANESSVELAIELEVAIEGLLATRDQAENKLRLLDDVDDSVWMDDRATADLEDAWGDLRGAVLVAISTTYCEAGVNG